MEMIDIADVKDFISSQVERIEPDLSFDELHASLRTGTVPSRMRNINKRLGDLQRWQNEHQLNRSMSQSAATQQNPLGDQHDVDDDSTAASERDHLPLITKYSLAITDLVMDLWEAIFDRI
ncbi:unnamed protein product [Clonostachys rosea]|uniref:Uncharacterized protein n=1 Tax=Bionectria ochroleuca TaxID=29856 RepID=A0ABY6UGY4_BIOOC|nr:unnamed protein product [Clonostachys rosea]